MGGWGEGKGLGRVEELVERVGAITINQLLIDSTLYFVNVSGPITKSSTLCYAFGGPMGQKFAMIYVYLIFLLQLTLKSLMINYNLDDLTLNFCSTRAASTRWQASFAQP